MRNPPIKLGESRRRGNSMAGGDDVSEFNPPANEFYKQAAKLSVWGDSDMDGLIVDGSSSESSGGSVRRISDGGSFAGSMRSGKNSIAGMSRGSMSSTGSKGIRNFLGGKFKKRAESIQNKERPSANSA